MIALLLLLASSETIEDIHGQTTTVTHGFVKTNGLNIHYVRAGSTSGKTIVFLHGYPEFWYGWKEQIVHFANEGFDVIAPDLRGYNESDKPKGKGVYASAHVAKDIEGLIDQLAPSQEVLLVAHDWGGTVAWQVAYDRPDQIAHLVVCNVPHPNQIRDVKKRPWKYMAEYLGSLYVAVLGLPLLPEVVFKHVLGFDKAFEIFVLGNVVHKENITAYDKQRILDSWNIPGAIEAGTDYYRDNLAPFKTIPNRPLDRPVSLVFGVQDMFMNAKFLESFTDFQPGAYVVSVPDSGHYIAHDRPDAVIDIIKKAL